jgi:starch synthase
VARIGGLADTVIDANEMAIAAGVATGIQFGPVTVRGLETAITRAVTLWRDRETWCAVQRNGIATDVGWARSAQRYAGIYRELCAPSGIA